MNASNYQCSEGHTQFHAWNPTANAPRDWKMHVSH
jgi:hypothetical protein